MKNPKSLIISLILIGLAMNAVADVGPFDTVKFTSTFAVLWLVSFFSVILLGLIYSREKTLAMGSGIILLIFFLFIFIVLWGVISDYLSFLWLNVSLGLLFANLMPKKIKDNIKTIQNRNYVALLLIVLIIISQIVILTTSIIVHNHFAYNPTEKDWVKLQPMMASVSYNGSGGEFFVMFNNVAATSINVTSIVVTESYSSQPCGIIRVNDNAVGTSLIVNPGSAFKVDASGCNIKKRGDQYLMNITINYTKVVGGINTKLTETGSILGYAE